MDELIPIPESLSPRLAWLKAHGLRTQIDDLPRCYKGPATTQPWVCHNGTKIDCGFGDTEADAIFDYCQKFGVKHWLVEDHERT